MTWKDMVTPGIVTVIMYFFVRSMGMTSPFIYVFCFLVFAYILGRGERK